AADDATGIHDHGLAAAYLPIGGAAVWTRGVRPGRDDRLERDGIGTLGVEELLDRPRDLPLGPAHEGLVDEPLEYAVGDLARALDRRELVGILDRTEALDEAAPRNGLDRAVAERLVAW